ncbi:hypothetical protein AB0G06_43685 [Nonomuraea dietziae]|uniref:hypothetical protein n=1 Tax=Nonomuraea dietziae TaxID=65515 RepID=UPI0033E1316C
MIPDPEKAIMSALAHYMPDLVVNGRPRIYAQPPQSWDKETFLVVRATPGGASSRPELWSTCFFEVEAFAPSRSEASSLARRAQAACARAARENYRYIDGNEMGYLFDFDEVNAPSIIYDGLSSKHPDTRMFQGTYRLSVRALR